MLYRKPTHGNLYVNNLSHHHLTQKHATLFPLVYRAVNIEDEDHINEEHQVLKKVWVQNGFNHREVDRVLAQRSKVTSQQTDTEEEPPRSVAVVLFCGTVINRLVRILKRKNIKVVSCHPIKDQTIPTQ